MNAIEKKHRRISFDEIIVEKTYQDKHATITKDTAVGFAEWILNKKIKWYIDNGIKVWVSPINNDLITTSELYDIYVKSLEG